MTRGRPSLYTAEVVAEICERLSKGESLRQICRDEHLPDESTVRMWASDDLNGFYTQYARARDLGLDAMAEEVFDIADDGRNDWITRESARTGELYTAINEEAISRSRLRFDARRWYLSKLAPKRYGEKLETTHRGDPESPIVFSQTDGKL